METLDRERLARRRDAWRRWRDEGELPELPPRERSSAERRHRRTYWWLDLEEEEGRPPPEQTRGPLGGGPFERERRGSLIQSITTQPTPEAVAA